MELQFQILYEFFLDSNTDTTAEGKRVNNENDTKILHAGKQKKNELHQEFFNIL